MLGGQHWKAPGHCQRQRALRRLRGHLQARVVAGNRTKAIVKSGAKGAAKVAAAAAGAAAPVIMAAGEIGALVTDVAWDRVSKQNRSRARGIMSRLLYAEEDPASFEAYLNQKLLEEDQEIIGAVRSLINAAVDAVSPAAMAAMALLAREHLRQRTDTWIARGGLRVLAECTDAELGALRGLFFALAEPFRTRSTTMGPPVPIAVGCNPELRYIQIDLQAAAWWGDRLSDAPDQHRRLFRLLKAHGLADNASQVPPGAVALDAMGIQFAVIRPLSIALGFVQYPLRHGSPTEGAVACGDGSSRQKR